jgi:hypothetical protein
MSFPRLLRLPLLLLVLCLPCVTTACGVPLVVTAISYGADGASLITTGKSSTDHLLSMTMEEDCALWRAMQNKKVCKAREDGVDPYDVDYKTPERLQSEDGPYYQAPLRSAAAVPPTSWDSSAYKVAPSPEPPKTEPMTAAVANAAPEPVVAEPAPTPPPAKSKARSGKKPKAKPRKPSPGPAASRS